MKISFYLNKHLPLILWCAFIYYLSSISKTADIGPTYWTNFIAKKSAHLVEYAILAFLSYRSFNKSKLLTLIFTLLYAVSDEWHQQFIPFRESRIRDILIDQVGALLGLCLIKYIPPKIRQRLLV